MSADSKIVHELFAAASAAAVADPSSPAIEVLVGRLRSPAAALSSLANAPDGKSTRIAMAASLAAYRAARGAFISTPTYRAQLFYNQASAQEDDALVELLSATSADPELRLPPTRAADRAFSVARERSKKARADLSAARATADASAAANAAEGAVLAADIAAKNVGCSQFTE